MPTPAAACFLSSATTWTAGIAAVGLGATSLGYAALYNNSQVFAPVISEIQDKGAVALSFDDGPTSPFTPQILTILDTYAAKATFFLIGVNAAREKQLVREITDRGHTIGNHTWNHDHSGTLRGAGYWQDEMMRTQDILHHAAGLIPALFRAPMGFKTPAQAKAARQLGLHYIGWRRRGFDTLKTTPQHISRRISLGLRPGAIVTLHDGIEPARLHLSQQCTVDALPQILQSMRDKQLAGKALHTALPFSAYQNLPLNTPRHT